MGPRWVVISSADNCPQYIWADEAQSICCSGTAIGAAEIIFLWIMLIFKANMNGLMAASYSIQPWRQ